jgi:hypothetical protein
MVINKEMRMNMLLTPRNLAMHELLHLQYGYLHNHTRQLMTPEQLEEHADKLGALIGDVADIQAMECDVSGLAVVFTKKSDGVEQRYTVCQPISGPEFGLQQCIEFIKNSPYSSLAGFVDRSVFPTPEVYRKFCDDVRQAFEANEAANKK